MNAPLVLVVPALAIAAVATVVVPVLQQPHITSKRTPPALARRELARNARINHALAAFRAGDPSMEAEARAVVADLRPSDWRRVDFATELARRGEARAAYELARPYAHFNELTLPDDREMAAYAAIAQKAGHPEEAAWARERMGEDGHFRVWKRGTEQRFAHQRSLEPLSRSSYESGIDREIKFWLDSHPGDRSKAETLRQELLAAQ